MKTLEALWTNKLQCNAKISAILKKIKRVEVLASVFICFLLGISLGAFAPIPLGLSVFVGSNKFKIPSMYFTVPAILGALISGGVKSFLLIFVSVLIFLVVEMPFEDNDGDTQPRHGVEVAIICFSVMLLGKAIMGLSTVGVLSSVYQSIFAFMGVVAVKTIGQLVGFETTQVFNKEAYLYLIAIFMLAIGGIPSMHIGTIEFFTVASIVSILIFADRFGIAQAVAVAIVCSLVYLINHHLDESMFFYVTKYLCVLCTGALISAFFFKYGRIAGVAAAIFGFYFSSIMVVQSDTQIISLSNILIAASIYFLINWIRKMGFASNIKFVDDNNVIFQTGYLPVPTVITRLKGVSNVIKEYLISSNQTAVTTETNQIDLCGVYNKVSAMACQGCSISEFCWNKDFYKTCMMFNSLLEKAGNKYLTERDVPETFHGKCGRVGKVVNALNASYEVFRAEAIWKQQLDESRNLMNTQLVGISELIGEILENHIQQSEKINTKQAWLQEVIEREFGNNKLTLNIDKKGRCTIEIIAINCSDFKWDCDEVAKTLSEEMNVTIKPDYIVADELYNNRAVFSQKERYKLTVGHARKAREEDGMCGDSFANGKISNGMYLVGICDGMGSGEAAAKVSSNALSLLEGLLEAGVDMSRAAEFVNSIVMLQLGGESFVTMDNMVVDLHDGEMQLLKVGSAPSIICRKGRIEYISTTTIPLGLENFTMNSTRVSKLLDGDTVVIMSDGIFDVFVECKCEKRLEQLIKKFSDYDSQIAADMLLKHTIQLANEKQIKNPDDMTVLFIKMWGKR